MEYDNNIPIYLQIIDSIKTEIATGKINPGDKLPSTRQLAIVYGVNPNTASRVYREMENDRMVYTKRGMGTYVIESKEIIDTLKQEIAEQLLEQFTDGMVKLGFTKKEIVDCLVSKYEKEVE